MSDEPRYRADGKVVFKNVYRARSWVWLEFIEFPTEAEAAGFVSDMAERDQKNKRNDKKHTEKRRESKK